MFDQRCKLRVSLSIQVCMWGGDREMSQNEQTLNMERLDLSGSSYAFQ